MSQDTMGFLYWARSTIESDVFIYKPAEWFKIWFFLVSCAFWKDGKHLKRGEALLTLAEIATATRTTRDQVNKALRWARDSRMISTRKTTRGMVISIVNYAKYQDPHNKDRPHEDHRKTTGRPQPDYTIDEEQKNRRTEEQGNSMIAPPALTPREDAIDFFQDPDVRQPIIEALSGKGIPPEALKAEIDKFVLYWTEPTPNGKRQRWQTEKTFEVKRRLVTWLTNASKRGRYNSQQAEPKGIRL